MVTHSDHDIPRPSYPDYIRRHANSVLDEIQYIHNAEWPGWENDDVGIPLVVLGYLSQAMMYSPGTYWGNTNLSTEMTSLLYNSLITSSLHSHYNEIASTFIINISRYLTSTWDLVLVEILTCIVQNISYGRSIQLDEVSALRGWFESWLQPYVSSSLVVV